MFNLKLSGYKCFGNLLFLKKELGEGIEENIAEIDWIKLEPKFANFSVKVL